ncbi:MAG TPA: diaminopimelate epimerase [Pyrinomonadaceae bacterium]|nr:diaminopimelate epimerase [Pyrinomonadaceae bacterium]
MPPRFLKFHGFGNDYIVIEANELRLWEPAEFARRICNRHYGAGADGIALLERLNDDSADFRVRIFNPDGSEAGLSGNGTRCAAAYVHHKGIWSKPELRLKTRTGIKRYILREAAPEAGRYLFDSELGQPKFDSASIPMTAEPPLEKVVDYPLQVEGDTFLITALQMGNPNCCIFVEDFEALDWRRIGKAIEIHKAFPERTNVTFVRVQDRQTIELRIWERGVGETTASGTCSCAAAIGAMIKGQTDRTVNALMPGGEARIQWRTDSEVVITGTAEVIYSGDWLSKPLARA